MSTPSRVRHLAGPRRLRRGAALVEAAIVIPCMLLFLGLTMFTYKSYSTKIDRQTATRAGAMYYAQHTCERTSPALGDIAAGTEGQSSGVQDPSSVDGAGAVSGAATQGLSKDWQLARARPGDTTVTGSAINGNSVLSLQRKIHAESTVACNEKVYKNDFTAVFEFAVSFATSGGGIF